MKKTITMLQTLLLFLAGSLFLRAQYAESFDSGVFPPEGWQVMNTDETDPANGFFLDSTELAHVSPDASRYYVRLKGGQKLSQPSESWMITSAFTVGDASYLKFALASLSFPSSSDTLDILLSESGSELSDFETRLIRILPSEVFQSGSKEVWVEFCADLSAYKGKEIYLAFHNRAYAESYPERCELGIDCIRMESTPLSDLAVVRLYSPVADCDPEQNVVAGIYNPGMTVSSFDISYRLNDAESIDRTLTQELPAYTLTRVDIGSLSLEQGVNKVTVCLKNTDGQSPNDSLRVDDIVRSQSAEFPYVGDPSREGLDFTPGLAFYAPWSYMEANPFGWVWVGMGSMSGLLISPCLDMPAGKVRLSFDLMNTGELQFEFFRSTSGSWVDHELIAVSETVSPQMPFAPVSYILDIPKSGWQTIGLSIKGDAQVMLQNIRIEPMPENLALTGLLSPVVDKYPVSDRPLEVSVNLTNQGTSTRSGFALCYQWGSEAVVRESFTGSLEPNATESYVFSKKIDATQAKDQNLRIWLEDKYETLRTDDTVSTSLRFYEPVSVPYRMGFEEEEDFSLWTVYNPDRNPFVFWDCAPVPFTLPGKGSAVAFLPSLAGSSAEDMMITPAMELAPGRYRVSFFYAARIYQGADMTLSVLVADSPDPEALKQSERLSIPIDQSVWLNGYLYFDIETAGRYYVAFYARGNSAEVYIDDVRIDQEQDVCIVSASFEEETGYNKTVSPVRIRFRNHGIEPLTQADVSYTVNGEQIQKETLTLDLAPGAEYEHLFTRQADISACGEYTLSARVDIAQDADTINNSIVGASLNHYPNRTLPWFEDFALLENRLKWKVVDVNQDGNTWVPAASGVSYDAFSGSEALVYSSQNGVDGDDYIFSECLEIPADTVRFSFFYRTWKNIDSYKEDFTVGLYSYPHPDSLVMLIHDYGQVSVPGDAYEKQIYYFALPAPQNLYVGFYSSSKKGNGFIYIDDLKMEIPSSWKPLYVSDFEGRSEEWDAYPMGVWFDHWQYGEGRYGRNYTASLTRSDYSRPVGFLVSPAFAFRAEEKTILELDYTIYTQTEEPGGDTLYLYMGYENHPDSLHIPVARLTRVDTLSHRLTDSIQFDTDRILYFGFKPESVEKTDREKTTFYIESFSLKPAGTPVYTVSGTVVDPENNPIEGAGVGFVGMKMENTVTGADGRFRFEGLFDNQSFMVLVMAEGYQYAVKTDSIAGSDIDMGVFQLLDKTQNPMLVKAADKEDSAVISWLKQEELEEYRYDNGKVDNSLGLTKGTLEMPLAAVHRVPATLTEIEWYLVSKEEPKNFVSVFIFDLDKDGNPTRKILYRKDNVPNTDGMWSSHILELPVDCPNGFMIGVSYDGFLAIACDDGVDPDYPFAEQTHFILNLTAGTIKAFEESDIRRNLLLRARGVTLAETKKLEGFEVSRFALSDRGDETKWTLLTPRPIMEKSYTDKQWKDLPAGHYGYAVRSVYSLNVFSDWEFSNELACKMTASFTLAVESNLNKTEPDATVRLRGEENNAYYETKTNSSGTAIFERILKGQYVLTVLKDGFESESKSLEVTDTYRGEFRIEESLADPKLLEIRGTGSNTLLQWNDFRDINEGFEQKDGHKVFEINSSGNAGWKYIDADDTYTLGYAGLNWPGKGSKMAFQVFDPTQTTPVMQGSVYAPHGGSQYLTTFPSYKENGEEIDTVSNDDWIITPALDFSGDFDFTFYARSIADHNGLERMNVLYSVGTDRKEDFVPVTAGEYTDVPAEWTRYAFHLPARTKYVAIQCVSRLNLQFLLDDLSIKARSKGCAETYVIYADDKEVSRTDKTFCKLSELNLAPGKHMLGVKAVYRSGESKISKIPYEVTTNGILQTAEISVWPNPAGSYVNVESATPVSCYELYSLDGSCKKRECVESGNFRIDISDMTAGVYQLILKAGHGVREVKKIVKM